MKNKESKEVIYMVTYKDDRNRKHLTFVKGFSAVKFIEQRFGEIDFEPTENYWREVVTA